MSPSQPGEDSLIQPPVLSAPIDTYRFAAGSNPRKPRALIGMGCVFDFFWSYSMAIQKLSMSFFPFNVDL